MISLSRLIKASPMRTSSEKKIIGIKKITYEREFECENVHRERDIRALEEARREANKILREAEEAARAIKEQIKREKELWEKEKQKLIEEARKAGFAEGFEDGRAQGSQEWEEQLRLAKETVECSKRDYQEKLESAEKTILALGIKVAEKILSEKLAGDPEQFLPLVMAALKEAKEYKEISLHINPEHYQAVVDRKDQLLQLFPQEVEMYIYPDERLASGSCIIESPHGRIDASVDRQLEEIRKALFSLLESE